MPKEEAWTTRIRSSSSFLSEAVMGKLKEMLWSKATETDSSWTEENNYALAHVE